MSGDLPIEDVVDLARKIARGQLTPAQALAEVDRLASDDDAPRPWDD